MNNSAQIHVLEVIVVAGMLLMSLYFVRTFEFSPNITKTEENELEILGNGILTSLEGVPDNLEQYPSLLARYSTIDYKDEFKDYVNRSLPYGTMYEISLVDISEFSKHPENSINDHTTILKEALVKVGKEARSSRIIVIDGNIYKVVLTMFLTLR